MCLQTTAGVATTVATTPRRLLFIASIGNQKPYRNTRHSAGHLLLDNLTPLLRTLPTPAPFYTTWYSPSYMNESGPKLVRQLQRWFEKVDHAGSVGGWISTSGVAVPISTPSAGAGAGAAVPPDMPATLVILHDELESPLGKIRVRRGGPEAFSLRGHRGLISVCESLRGKGMYPSSPRQEKGTPKGQGKKQAAVRELSILRVGVGIGRPESRGKNAVADYVLTEMDERELEAVRRAAAPVADVIGEEFFFEGKGDE